MATPTRETSSVQSAASLPNGPVSQATTVGRFAQQLVEFEGSWSDVVQQVTQLLAHHTGAGAVWTPQPPTAGSADGIPQVFTWEEGTVAPPEDTPLSNVGGTLHADGHPLQLEGNTLTAREVTVNGRQVALVVAADTDCADILLGLAAAHLCQAHPPTTDQATRQFQQLQEQFIQTASHELRTPVTVVHGMTELLADPATRTNLDVQQRQQMAAAVHRNARALRVAVERLTMLSQISGRRQTAGRYRAAELAAEAVDVVTEELPVAHRNVTADDIAARVTLEVEPTLVHTDRTLLVRLLAELVGNGLVHTSGDVHVGSATSDSGQLQLSVSDDGTGFDRAPQLLVGSARAPLATRGLGVGWALVQACAVCTGTDVSVGSTNRGTTVTVTVPTPDGGSD